MWGRLYDGCFRVVFLLVGKIMFVLPSFGLVGSGGRMFYFWITARPHAIGFGCGGCLSVFVRFLGLSLFCDSSDLKGF